ncbi:MAG: sialidase family protein [Candidatus Eisenbacteria bacterium]
MRSPKSFCRRRFLLLLPILAVASPAGADDYLNARLNQDATAEVQNEQQIVVNPANPENLVAVWRDFRLGYRQVAWAYTFDGGYSWSEGGLFQESNYPYQSDPGLTAARNGDFYAVILSFTSTAEPNGLYVYRSIDGGVSWGAPSEVVNQVPNVFEDKEFIACDRTGGAHDGNLYVAWSRFGATSTIVFRRSTDGGGTWGPTYPVDDAGGSQFPIPVVGRNGDVYVAWGDYYNDVIKLDVSTDGGATFGTDRIVTGVYTVFTTINGGIDAYGSPQMDADITDGPFAGRLYLAFMDRRGGAGDFDIWVTTSDDGGAHWTGAVRVNDDAMNNGRDQFLPWITVDDVGIATVVFLDRRDDPANLSYHCYLAQSGDGGATWSPNVRVSTAPSDPAHALRADPDRAAWAMDKGSGTIRAALPTVSRAGLLGEYIGVACSGGYATPVWTDIRNLNQDTYAGYPLVKTAVAGSLPDAAGPSLTVAPHPLRAREPLSIRAPFARGVLALYDVRGRRVGAHLLDGAAMSTAGLTAAALFGRDRSPAPGIYFLRLESPDGNATARVVIVE